MGVWSEGKVWCFCGGGGRSERLKGSIFTGKGPAMASIFSGSCSRGQGMCNLQGAGFLIHRNLLLTTHGTLPSAMAAESAEIQLNHGRLPARLTPSRFFITSSVLDLTIVGLDTADTRANSQCHQPYYLKTGGNPSLDLGNTVYLLSYTNKDELTVGQGKVVIATDNLIKLSAEGSWCPGSAGFDEQGNLAFMICDPMKLASSPNNKCSTFSSSSPSCKGDSLMLFGIPIPIILDWLRQHWKGSLDELSKPRLPMIRLLSTGQKIEHYRQSFVQRQIFKPEEEDPDIPSTVIIAGKSHHEPGSSSLVNAHSIGQGIPTPEIYESSGPASGMIRKKESAPVHQLLDINFPPRAPRSIALPLPLKQLLPEPVKNVSKELELEGSSRDEDFRSEVQSSSSPPEVLRLPHEFDGFSSGEETMYSAETMESRNIPSPPIESKLHQFGRSRSCVNYSRWTSAQRSITTKTKGMLQKQHSMIPTRKTQSHVGLFPQKSHEYYSPTVSSNMKKRNGSDCAQVRPRQSAVQVTTRWML
ncbi:hypothetical protein HPP92_011784 [Vanilla planifolia]|uniref:Uncharacterized protein n=1 Tax=Vanilla planifolia TaxID=51239 RepID=A0A835V2P9_VANPL|nr:hypothetical protein HPP92_011784 [Vanilla planifolia]